MDAVNLQFLWTNFPGIAASTGKLKWAAGLYRQLLIEERRHQREGLRKWDSARAMRRSILERIEARLVQEETDDWVVALAV